MDTIAKFLRHLSADNPKLYRQLTDHFDNWRTIQPPITAPNTQYPVPPYLSGAIDNMVVPPFGLPNDKNTFDPATLQRAFQENT